MTLRVGLVGAGPWATRIHGPGLAGSDHTELAGVWARRPDAAATLAADLQTRTYASMEALLDDVDTVAFAVPPGPQAELALLAATAGRHLILDKPLAADLAAAERLTDAVETAGVASAVFFTCRYTEAARTFLTAAGAGRWDGARAGWVSGALLHGEFADSRWRHDRGALWDVGPHAVELLDAALGPVNSVRAALRGPRDLVQLVLEHERGRISQATLSLRVPVERSADRIELLGESGALEFALSGLSAVDAYAVMLTELAGQVDGTAGGPSCDAHRGLAVQRVLSQAEALMA